MSGERRDIVIVGCGRWLRGDDQAGLLVAEALLAARLPHTRVFASESPSSDVALYAVDAELLVIVDAARSGEELHPGSWRRLDHHQLKDRLRESDHPNAHTLGVATALKIAESLSQLPTEVWIYVIGVEQADYGDRLSQSVMRGIREMSGAICRDVVLWHQAQMELSHA